MRSINFLEEYNNNLRWHSINYILNRLGHFVEAVQKWVVAKNLGKS